MTNRRRAYAWIGECHIQKLPLELIYHICSFLSRPLDAVSLSLTCKVFSQGLYSRTAINRSWYIFFDHNGELKALVEKYKEHTANELWAIYNVHLYFDTDINGFWHPKYTTHRDNQMYSELDKVKILEVPYVEYNPDVDYRKKILDASHGKNDVGQNICKCCMRSCDLFFPETWCLKFQSISNENSISFCKECIRYLGGLCGEYFILEAGADMSLKSLALVNGIATGSIRFAFISRDLRNEAQRKTILPSQGQEIVDAMMKAIEDSLIGDLALPDQGSGVVWYRPDIEDAIKKVFGVPALLTDYKSLARKQTSYLKGLKRLLTKTIIKKYKRNEEGFEFPLYSRNIFDKEFLDSYIDAKWDIFSIYSGNLLTHETDGGTETPISIWGFPRWRDDVTYILLEGMTRVQKLNAEGKLVRYDLDWMFYHYTNVVGFPQVDIAYKDNGLDGSALHMKNVFSCIEKPPLRSARDWSKKGEKEWLESSAGQFIKNWMCDPDLESEYSSRDRTNKMRYYHQVGDSQNGNVPEYRGLPEHLELTFVERAIWEYASPKFSPRQSRKAGLCRVCDDHTYYTAFEYAIHLYRNHPDYFQEDGKWKFRTTDKPEEGTKEELKQVIPVQRFASYSNKLRLDEISKELIKATKRYGPYCMFAEHTGASGWYYGRQMRIKHWCYFYLH